MRVKLFMLTLLLCLGLLCQPISVTSSCAATGAPPATDPTAPQAPPPATFRVTLNGFKVNHESDDDILEGDGRGDEIFITASRWLLNAGGASQILPAPNGDQYLQTKVMGDPNGHPERVPAGTKSPGLRLDEVAGGLQTGDTFPTRTPWVRNREPLPDRPPIILWQGDLTRGQNLVQVTPIIWEWDSEQFSASQNDIRNGLINWFEDRKPALTNLISSPSSFSALNPVNNVGIFFADKSGTRPIGISDDADIRIFGVGAQNLFFPQSLVLTYDSAMNASHPRDASQRVIPMRYFDAHDHGDYTLYLQVDQVVALRQTIPQGVVRPRP